MTAEAIAAALDRQLGCYRKLLKLSELQRGYIEQNQTDALIVVLQERQAVLTDIATWEETVGPLKREWNERSPEFDEATRAAFQANFADARALLQRITQADQDDVLLLQQKKLSVGKQLRQTTDARQINRNYAASAYGKAPPKMNITS